MHLLADTVDDIAAQASVSHGLAYRYFANKEAIFYELLAQDLQARSLPHDLDQSNLLRVPGASLFYKVLGSGPVLLVIAGGEGGALGYAAVADLLAVQYTVVTYDRRGASRSSLDDPAQDVRLEMHSDDARRLLAALPAEPAYVFGSSAGALIGLDLAIRFPDQVRTLVAHEPPVEGVLPEIDRFQAGLLEAYRLGGGLAALKMFVTQLGMNDAETEPGVALPPRSMQDAAQRGESLVAYTFRAVHSYRLDLAALSASPVRIVLAGGSAGRSSLVYRCTLSLAGRLGVSVLDFPGHQLGCLTHPRAFADRLRGVLEEQPAA